MISMGENALTLRDCPNLRNPITVRLTDEYQEVKPDVPLCTRCGALAGITWQAACGHLFCIDCKDALTHRGAAAKLTCPVHLTNTHKSQLKRTDVVWKSIRNCTVTCPWTPCHERGTVEQILGEHLAVCPHKPPRVRTTSWVHQDRLRNPTSPQLNGVLARS